MYLTKKAELNLPASLSSAQSKWIHAYLNDDKTSSINDTLSLFTDKKQLNDSIKMLSFYGGGKDVLAGLTFLLNNKTFANFKAVVPKKLNISLPQEAYIELNKSLLWIYQEMIKLLTSAKSTNKFNTTLFNDLIHFNTLILAAREYIKQKNIHEPIPEITMQNKGLLAQIKADIDYAKNDELIEDYEIIMKKITEGHKQSLHNFIPGYTGLSTKYANENINAYIAKIADFTQTAVMKNNPKFLEDNVLNEKIKANSEADLDTYFENKLEQYRSELKNKILSKNPDIITIKAVAKNVAKYAYLLYAMQLTDFSGLFKEQKETNVPLFQHFPREDYSAVAQELIESNYNFKIDAPISILKSNEKDMLIDFINLNYQDKDTFTTSLLQEVYKIENMLGTRIKGFTPYINNQAKFKAYTDLLDIFNDSLRSYLKQATDLFHQTQLTSIEAHKIKHNLKCYLMTLNLFNHVKTHKDSIQQLLKQKQNIKDFYLLPYMKYPDNYYSSEASDLIAKNSNISADLDELLKVARNTSGTYYLTSGDSKYNTLLKIFNPETNSFDNEKLRNFLIDLFTDITNNEGYRLQRQVRDFITEFKNSDDVSEYMQNINIQMYQRVSDKYAAMNTLLLKMNYLSEKELQYIIEDIVAIDNFKLNAALYTETTQDKVKALLNKIIYSSKEIELDVNITPAKAVRIYENDSFLGEYKYLYAFKFIKNKINQKPSLENADEDRLKKLAKTYTDHILESHTDWEVDRTLNYMLSEDTATEFIEENDVKQKGSNIIVLTEDAKEFMDTIERNKKL